MKRIQFKILLMISVCIFMWSFVAPVSAVSIEEDDISSASVLLIDADTGTVLFEYNADERRAPASTTKIMTAVLALENFSLDQEITVPAEAQTSGTNMGLEPGYVVTVETLLYGMLMCSGNDAAVTLAVTVAGSVENFAGMMNKKAQELGMESSQFVTASGLDEEGHYVTVRDMGILVRYALTFDSIREIAATPTCICTTVDKTVSFPLENTNRLIYTPQSLTEEEGSEPVSYEYAYATGLKTGSTSSAQNCLVATAEKGGQQLIALIYGDPTSGGTERWTLSRQLFEYGFSEYTNVALADFADEALSIGVIGGAVVDGASEMLECTPVAQDGSGYITLQKDVNIEDIEYRVYPYENVAAPVEEGQVVGTVELYLDGGLLFSGNLAATQGIMTEEDYTKLTGSALSTIDPAAIKAEKEGAIQNLVWLWLLIPVLGITFFIVRAVRADKRRMRRYLRSAQSKRRNRREHVGVRYSQIRRQTPPYNRNTNHRRY